MPFRDRQISQEAFLRRAVDSRAIGDLQSDGWVSSTAASPAGWKIWKNGDAQFNNVTIIGDAKSGNWDGSTALSSTGPDPTASSGWFLDESAGIGQFQKIYAEGGELGTLDITGDITLGSTTGPHMVFASYRSTAYVPGAILETYDDAGLLASRSEGALFVGSGDRYQAFTLVGSSDQFGIELNQYAHRIQTSTGYETTLWTWGFRNDNQASFFNVYPKTQFLVTVNGSTRILASTAGVELGGPVDITGTLTVDSNAGMLRLDGNGSTGTAYLTFYRTGGSTRTGYVGVANPANDDLSVTAEDGDVYINALNSGSTSQDIFLRTDDSGGTLRNRLVIDGDAAVTVSDKNGTARLQATTAGVGFSGGTPARPNYTVTGGAADRAISSTAGTTEIRNVLQTVINDFISMGLFQ